MTLATLASGLLRRFDPETAHGLAIKALKYGVVPAPLPVRDTRLQVRFFDLTLANPLGMAAGFDKNAEVPDALIAMGFGFAEVGTLTPRPQSGNPKPRIFRLPEAKGVINRLGFNNEGHQSALARLSARSGNGVVGVNVGANKDSQDRAGDYVAGVSLFARFASYFTANVSSPNTPGLRDLQAREALDDLLGRVVGARDDTIDAAGRRVPVLLKIAPDVTEEGLDDIADVAIRRGIDGLIVSNTTVSRAGLTHPLAGETGGLSGAPLFERSTIVLAKMRERVGPKPFIIGVGGVADAASAVEKIAAGADAVQLYTGFIYGGPALVPAILTGMLSILDREKVSSVAALRSTRLSAWADRPIPV
ncbi:quinone-dependent dihydroorotate dehydrogenase [Chthonobacter albigriseus]|uniref:quinone-dependent dihydroorotate dehydrogenase n=1 Tax=Chthonobacter albigriseus TaxID=1683161 RepID=UPI0015EEE165|nr:quinone-dependent dihydroorotate dehydrogenase [Chthonobacter albigriseus]